jgi:hypothetical protein
MHDAVQQQREARVRQAQHKRVHALAKRRRYVSQ